MNPDELKNEAEMGVREAQYIMGLSSQNGLWSPADPVQAEIWYRKAAQQGFAAAQYELALILSRDETLHKEAIRSARAATDNGFCPAMLMLASWYEAGFCVPEDAQEAFRLTLLAAENNYSKAAIKIAFMYEQGRGVEADSSKAFAWFSRAAALGQADAAYAVGQKLESGIGVEKDEIKALEWYSKGCELGSPWAWHALSRIYRTGKLGQIIDAAKANECAIKALELLRKRGAGFRSRNSKDNQPSTLGNQPNNKS